MHTTIIGLLAMLLAACAGCTRAPSSRDDGKAVPAHQGDRMNPDASVTELVFDEPVFPAGSPFTLLPVRLDSADEDGYPMYGSTQDPGPPVANILFVDNRTGESRRLLDHAALITRFEAVRDTAAGATASPAILYAIIDRDTDGDGALTDFDEAGCHISDPAGAGLRRITPQGLSVTGWYASGSTFYIRALADTDGDHAYGAHDRQQHLLRYDLGAGGEASRVVSDSLIRAVVAIREREGK